MNPSKTALILAVSGGIALSGCKEEKSAPPPSPKPPEAVVLEVKKFSPKSVESMSARCRSQLETILNRQQYKEFRGKQRIRESSSPYERDLSTDIDLGTPNSAYNSVGYFFNLKEAKKYEPCYALAQESLKNFGIAQGEANFNLGMYQHLDDDYRGFFQNSIWPIHFNKESGSVQLRNWFVLLLVLAASGAIGAGGYRILSNSERKALEEALRSKEEDLKTARSESASNASQAETARKASEKLKKSLDSSNAKITDLRREAEEAKKKTEDAESAHASEVADLRREMSDMRDAAEIGARLSSEVSDILDFWEEFASKFNEIIKRKRQNSKSGYSQFVAVSGSEIAARIERLSARVMRNRAFMNESNSGYFALMFALEAESQAYLAEFRYKKAFDTAVRCEGACEMLESLIFQCSANSAETMPGTWDEFKMLYEQHLLRMGALADDGSLLDFFEIMGVAKPVNGWSETFAKGIDATYRSRAQKEHPDKNPGDARAEANFKRLSRAREALRNRESYEFYAAAHSLFFR